jgi:hypothetical protein
VKTSISREILAGQLASFKPGEQVVAVFDDSNDETFRVVGTLRPTGSQGLLLGPTMVRSGAGVVASNLRTIALCTPDQVPPVGFRERVAQVLIQHQRVDAGHCLCGFAKLGMSHADHVADYLAGSDVVIDAALVVERVRKVFTDMSSSHDWEDQVSMGFAATFDQEVDMVLADCGPTSSDHLAAISAWIDNSSTYQAAPQQLADTWRVSKIFEEFGEAVGAAMGSMGENPRKGVTHSRADLESELLDIAAAALGALMHFHDNDPAADIIGYLIEHIRTRAIRAIPHGLVMPPERPELRIG